MKPLKGVKVVELAEWIAAPGASRILADWGAEILKIERPDGDPFRMLTSIQGTDCGEENIWFNLINHNKRLLRLNLKHDDDRNLLRRLVAKADVFVTNYRGPALRRLGMTYEDVHALNPRIIYASLTGFGREGSESEKPGYDYVAFWARSGLMGKLAEGMTEPPYMRPALGDNIAALALAGGIVAVLYGRTQTGRGSEVSTSLYQVGAWVLNFDMQARLSLGEEIVAQDRAEAPNPLWNYYRTQDGRWLQLAMLQSDRYWPLFCVAVDRPDLINDGRFADVANRQVHCRELVGILDSILGTKPASEWRKVFASYDLVFEVSSSVDEVVQDPQAWANGFFEVVGDFTTVASPIRFVQMPHRSTTFDAGEPEISDLFDGLRSG